MSDYTKGRLEALREEMTEEGINAYLVPHSDEWGNEFLPECSKRLEWLTGFTGSAGFAIVTRTRAAIFVDGRYTEQVRNEVDGSCFEYRHVLDEPLTDWLTEHCAEGNLVGYDPKTNTTRQIGHITIACAKRGVRLVPVEENLIDVVWHDRPEEPSFPIAPHEIRFAGVAHSGKRIKIAEKMKEHGADAAFLASPASVCWLLNIRGRDVPWTPLALCRAIIYADKSVCLFIDPKRITPEISKHLGPNIDIVPSGEDGYLEATFYEIGALGKTVLIDPSTTSAWVEETLRRAGTRIVEGPDPCALPKACKSKTEIDGAREAHRRDGVALATFFSWLNGTMAKEMRVTEFSAAEALMEFRRRGEHYRGLSFPTISAVGENGAIVHYQPRKETAKTLESGMLYLVDSGAQYRDGTTDVTRTIFLGVPKHRPTKEMREHYTRVLKGHLALAATRFPKGTTGHQIDAIARRPLWEAGLDFDHGTGHGVGSYLGVHEGPQRITRISTPEGNTPLEAGMIVSDEPGYYRTDKYGIRIENLVVVVPVETPDGGDDGREFFGFETLTLAPYDVSLVDTSLLSMREMGQINEYHRRVYDELHGFLDKEAGQWLRLATRPLLYKR